MSWISGPCDEREEERNVVPAVDDEEIGYVVPRMIWGGATHYAGIVDRVNPGHFERVSTSSDGGEDH